MINNLNKQKILLKCLKNKKLVNSITNSIYINCILCYMFDQERYIDMFDLFLESILIYGNINTNIHILIYTSTSIMDMIIQNKLYNNNIIFEINDNYIKKNEMCEEILNLQLIKKYNKILYTDINIIIKNDINKIFCDLNILKYDNKLLLENDIKLFIAKDDININSNKIIHYFTDKTSMYNFYNMLNKYTFSTNIKIYNINIPPKKNNIINLIGICVSYNYFDTLQFMLPINYLHFEKIYLITQEDDINTLNFCKNFDNVIILLYDFKNNNKKFDKFGALNYAQKIVYTEYPDHWYILIDSDILLPNNFIDILLTEKLNDQCIYGIIRYNLLKSSELLYKKNIQINKNIIFNNIINKLYKKPTIIGFFQLYKKHVYHKDNLIDASLGDIFFCHDNFNLFCMLENIICFHLGQIYVNWKGKLVSFIDDINISLNNIYYIYHKDNINKYTINKYYDINCHIV